MCRPHRRNARIVKSLIVTDANIGGMDRMTITALIKTIEDKEVVKDGFHLNDYEYGFNCGLAAAISSVEDELISCKDCKHMQEDKIFHQCWCNGREVKYDHFCGYAERRKE